MTGDAAYSCCAEGQTGDLNPYIALLFMHYIFNSESSVASEAKLNTNGGELGRFEVRIEVKI